MLLRFSSAVFFRIRGIIDGVGMDIFERIDQMFDDNKQANSRTSPEDKELIKMRLMEEAAADPVKTEKFLDTIEREKFVLNANYEDAGSYFDQSLNVNRGDPDFVNVRNIYFDPRNVGQPGFDLMGTTIDAIVESRMSDYSYRSQYDILADKDPFGMATSEERQEMLTFQDEAMRSLENRLGVLQQDYPESFQRLGVVAPMGNNPGQDSEQTVEPVSDAPPPAFSLPNFFKLQ